SCSSVRFNAATAEFLIQKTGRGSCYPTHDLSVTLIPPPQLGAVHVDAVGEHGKSLRPQLHFNLPLFSRARPVECPGLQSLGQQPSPRAIEVEDLQKPAPLVGKHTQRAAATVLLELLGDHGVQRV